MSNVAASPGVEDAEERVQGPVYQDPDDPFSILNLVNDTLRDRILALPPELLEESEEKLRKLVKPTSTDYALRVSFWREFDRVAVHEGTKITNAQVFTGICTDTYWYNRFCKSDRKLAWMIRPLQSYKREMEAVLARSTERLWELLELPIKDAKGRYDTRAAEILLKTVQSIENRVKGMAVQRIAAKSVGVNLNVGAKPAAAGKFETMADVNARIAQLEREIEAAGATVVPAAAQPALPAGKAPVVIDVPLAGRETVVFGLAKRSS